MLRKMDENNVQRSIPSTNHIKHEFNRTDILFVTVCNRERKPILNNPHVHEALKEVWKDGSHWQVGRYVVMPDHLHFFAGPHTSDDLLKWIRYWKRELSLALKGCETRIEWLPRYWDTQMRTGTQYESKWQYVRQNPVRAGLVQEANDWPYQGEKHILPWHGPA